METLKNKMLQLLSRILSIEEFEAWLYADSYVNDQIESNPIILELLTIDFRSKSVMIEIEKILFKQFGEDEVKLAIVETNCSEYLEQPSIQNAEKFLINTHRFYEWQEEFNLFDQIESFFSDWSSVQDGYYFSKDFKYEFNRFIESLHLALKSASALERIKILNEGVTIKAVDTEFKEEKKVKPKRNFRFNFGFKQRFRNYKR